MSLKTDKNENDNANLDDGRIKQDASSPKSIHPDDAVKTTSDTAARTTMPDNVVIDGVNRSSDSGNRGGDAESSIEVIRSHETSNGAIRAKHDSPVVDNMPEDAETVASERPVPDFSKFKPSQALLKQREWKSRMMAGIIALAFVVAMVPLISLLWTTIARGVKRLNLNFLTFNMSGVIGGMPTPSGGHGGIEHAIIGTLEVTLGAMLISVPIGLMCAIYLTEYARGSKFAKAISLLVNVMSGIPSIVAGLFAFSLFAILMGPGVSNGFEGSVALSILMIPTVVNSSVEMLRIVPDDLREASYALGVTKSRTIVKVVLRTALPGIVSGVILAIARVIGETAPLLMTAGFIVTTNWNLFSGQMTTLPVFVYQEYSKMSVTCPPNAGPGCVASIPSERSWAAALVLIAIVLVLNLIGRLVQRLFSVEAK